MVPPMEVKPGSMGGGGCAYIYIYTYIYIYIYVCMSLRRRGHVRGLVGAAQRRLGRATPGGGGRDAAAGQELAAPRRPGAAEKATHPACPHKKGMRSDPPPLKKGAFSGVIEE